MSLSRNMLWALPFLSEAADLVPLHRVRRVSGYRLAPGVVQQALGSCDRKRGRYSVSVLLSDNESCIQETAAMLDEALISLAHELAHVVHWDHSPEHLALTARILRRFARVARRQGVRDTSRRLKRRVA